MSYLIQHDRLELKIIEPKEGTGISHTKVGVFNDGENRVSFDGSCNFSKTALIDNLESLTVSCDWDGPVEEAKIQDIANDFLQTFTEQNQAVNYLDAAAIKTNIAVTFNNNDIVSLLKDEYELMDKSENPMNIPNRLKLLLVKRRKRLRL